MNCARNSTLHPQLREDEALVVENAIRLAIDSIINVLYGVNSARTREYQRMVADRDKEIQRLERRLGETEHELQVFRRQGCASRQVKKEQSQVTGLQTSDDPQVVNESGLEPSSMDTEETAEQQECELSFSLDLLTRPLSHVSSQSHESVLQSSPSRLGLDQACTSHYSESSGISDAARNQTTSPSSSIMVKEEPCDIDDTVLIKWEMSEERIMGALESTSSLNQDKESPDGTKKLENRDRRSFLEKPHADSSGHSITEGENLSWRMRKCKRASTLSARRTSMAVKAGRKRNSPIWDYFEYDSVCNRSKCLAVKGSKVCGALLKGKNPTNLKVHLRSSHKEVNRAYLAKVRESGQPVPSEQEASSWPGSMMETTTGQTTLMQSLQEHDKWEEAMVNMFIETGMSTYLSESIAFKTPGAARINCLIEAKMDTAKQKLKESLREARKLTLCVDGWSKRGLTAAFMGVSACFYHPTSGQVHHALLNLHRMEHPHTQESIARCIDQTLNAWGIEEDKVLIIVTDNGSGIVKAVRLLSDRRREQQSEDSDGRHAGDGMDELWMGSGSEDSGDEEIGGLDLDQPEEGRHSKFQTMPSLTQTLQLMLKDTMKHPSAQSVITKARKLVHSVRKSAVANEDMIKRCGKTLTRDCSTCWISTFDMLKRLLETRAELNQLLEDLGMDTLLTSDWRKLEDLVKLLEPFAINTEQLESDSQPLSHVVPCLLNLEAHLLTTNVEEQLAQVLLNSLRERFSGVLNPDSLQFDATPAGACLMDPSVSLVLQSPDTVPLRRAAQSFVLNLAAQYDPAIASQDDEKASQSPAGASLTVRKKYSYLASHMEANVSSTNQPNATDSLSTELDKYVKDVKQGGCNETPLQFWKSRESVYPKLAPVALDLISAPASLAFVERIFSVSGLLSSGQRNRETISLERHVFLKINKKLLLD
ncbi:uncharacterized protein LOC141800652 isoform X1 [Halichoeres trimaculatus]|uniref:uncharacterized protein LOC141800652 isoform X1 n=1 Tax=Halichoeres trimaculatus TaxID=147232 RepID=UPI003D9F7F8A